VASASTEASMAFVVPLPRPVTRRPGSTARSSRRSYVPRSAVAWSSTGPTVAFRTWLAGTERSTAPVSVSRLFPPPRTSAVSARSLTGPSARSWARFTWRSSTCPRSTRAAFTSPRACSASSALPARPVRSARAASPSRPPSPESSTGTLGVHDGVSARPTAGGTTRRSSLACSDEPFRVPEPVSTSPASPRSTAASRAFSSPLPRTESCNGPFSIPETEARPCRRPSNAPVGPA